MRYRKAAIPLALDFGHERSVGCGSSSLQIGVGGDRQQVWGLGSENRLSALRKTLISFLKGKVRLYKSFD